MQRLRSTWMALMGGILLVALSLTAALGAPPNETDGPRGQSVAAFVHGLIFGEETSEEDPEEEEQEDEENSEDELQQEDQEELEQNEGEEDEESDSHGACVSEVAHDKAGENDPEDAEYRSHGERVSEAARVLCWETVDEEDPEEVVEEEQEDEESDSHGACVSEVAHDKAGENDPEDAEYRNHGERVSEAARVLCRESAEEGDPEEDLESDAGSTTAVPGGSVQPGAHGRANAPGQQKGHASGSDRGGRPDWAGGGGGPGRGGR